MSPPIKSEYKSEEIRKETFKRVKQYEKFNFFEKYSIYMGKVQILEFGLKNILIFNYEYIPDDIEKWTLGRTEKELSKNHLRKDFLLLLESIVQSRNYIAHELLINKSVLNSIIKSVPTNHYTKDEPMLDNSIIELEEILFLYDVIQENNAWS